MDKNEHLTKMDRYPGLEENLVDKDIRIFWMPLVEFILHVGIAEFNHEGTMLRRIIWKRRKKEGVKSITSPFSLRGLKLFCLKLVVLELPGKILKNNFCPFQSFWPQQQWFWFNTFSFSLTIWSNSTKNGWWLINTLSGTTVTQKTSSTENNEDI